MSSMNDRQEMSIGVDMGGTSIKFAVVRGAEIVAKGESVQTKECGSPDDVIAAVGHRLRALKEKYPAVRAVGMGLPGFVNHAAGVVDSLTNVPGWYNVPIRHILEEESGLPAAVENDANCMALAEWKLGAGRGMQDIVCLTLGTGVGAGIITQGQLLRGHLGAAGELGQVGIDYCGRIGHYGNRGAVEDYIGNGELAREAQMRYAAEQGVYKPLSELTPIHLENAAKAGCPVALGIWDDAARKLSACLLTCHYILNPQAFVIGGGMAKAGELLFSSLRSYLKAQIYPPHFERLQLLPAQFGGEAGIIGAAFLALEDLAASR